MYPCGSSSSRDNGSPKTYSFVKAPRFADVEDPSDNTSLESQLIVLTVIDEFLRRLLQVLLRDMLFTNSGESQGGQPSFAGHVSRDVGTLLPLVRKLL